MSENELERSFTQPVRGAAGSRQTARRTQRRRQRLRSSWGLRSTAGHSGCTTNLGSRSVNSVLNSTIEVEQVATTPTVCVIVSLGVLIAWLALLAVVASWPERAARAIWTSWLRS